MTKGEQIMDEHFVLAMYDVRGKQDFIFKTNKLQEIVGASWIIRDVFKDYLFPAAQKIGEETGCKGIYTYKDFKSDDSSSAFSWDGFRTHINDEGYIGEVVYDGGGNFLLLFKDAETFQKTTFQFTKSIMEEIGTLRVLGTCIDVYPENDNYKEDNAKLYYEHGKNERRESVIFPWSALPIVQVDRKTSMPLVDYTELLSSKLVNYPDDVKKSIEKSIQSKGVSGKLSKESFAKLLKYFSEIRKMKDNKEHTDLEEFYILNENNLDQIIEKKGEDSKLAVVYIDGNSMGAKVQELNQDSTTYENCVSNLRNFSEEIQRIYVEEGTKIAFEGKDIKSTYRIVVSAGDEINFIVKAREAFSCAKKYLEKLSERKKASACAGICVFNSHSPYADAYRIAEEACESGKKLMKEKDINCASFIDFHLSQGVTGISLEEIRKRDNGDGIISRPWMIWNKDTKELDGNVTDFGDVNRIVKFLNLLGRSNVKGLAGASKNGKVALDLELKRIFAHQSEEFQKKNQEEFEWLYKHPKRQSLLYDISIAFDLWFC